VVKGATAYEEDKWDWMKIGNVILRNVKPCTRCIFTTVDPETGTKNAKVEPLKTLKRYVENTSLRDDTQKPVNQPADQARDFLEQLQTDRRSGAATYSWR
jgi:uncharacterized protein YcbX